MFSNRCYPHAFWEMIVFASPSKPFTHTAKGTVRRQAVINEYAAEIEKIYESQDSAASLEITLPTCWDEEGTLTFVRNVVHTAMERPVEDGVDLHVVIR